MGADKKSSRRSNSTYAPNSPPRIPTQLPRSCSHSEPTNPRNKPQTIPKLKWNSRSKGLSSSARHQADSPQGWGGRSADTRWTVRDPRADSPEITIEPPVEHLEKRTVRESTADGLSLADGRATPGGLSGQLPPNKNHRHDRSERSETRTHEEHEEQLTAGLLTDGPPNLRGRSARCGNSSPSPTSQRSNHPSRCPISRINQGIATKS
jgi:hypothetical protein